MMIPTAMTSTRLTIETMVNKGPKWSMTSCAFNLSKARMFQMVIKKASRKTTRSTAEIPQAKKFKTEIMRETSGRIESVSERTWK